MMMYAMKHRLTFSLLAAIAVGLIWSNAAQAGVAKSEFYDYWHQALANQSRYNGVGLLTITTSEGIGSCSGTVIDDSWILTAAHCVDEATALSFTVDGKTYAGSEWFVPTSYTDFGTSTFIGNDVALVKIDSVFDAGLSRAQINRDTTPTEIGKKTTTVGYGTWGSGLTGAIYPSGTKRAGHNRIDETFLGNDNILQWDMDVDFQLAADLGIPIDSSVPDYGIGYPYILEFNTAPGDSGGSQWIDDEIISVTSGGLIGGAGFGDTSFNTRMGAWADFIDEVIANDGLTDTLGTIGTITKSGSAGGGPIMFSAEAEALRLARTAALINEYAEYYDLTLEEIQELEYFTAGDTKARVFWEDDNVNNALFLGDINGDGVVDQDDADLVDQAITNNTQIDEIGRINGLFVDVNRDGTVDQADAQIVSDNFGLTTLLPDFLLNDFNLDGVVDADELAQVGIADLDGNGVLDSVDLDLLALGDLNADGVLDQLDLAIITSQTGQSIGDDLFLVGDVDFDGEVTQDDYDLVSSRIPEPATIGLLLFGGLVLWRRR